MHMKSQAKGELTFAFSVSNFSANRPQLGCYPSSAWWLCINDCTEIYSENSQTY